MRGALCAGLRSAGALQAGRVAFDTLVTDLDALLRDALIDAALVVEELVGDAGRAGSGQSLASQARIGAWLAVVRAGVLYVAVGALGEALGLVQEQEVADATAQTVVGRAGARQAGRVAKIAALISLIEVAVCGALLDAGIFLKQRTPVFDLHRLGVAAQTD